MHAHIEIVTSPNLASFILGFVFKMGKILSWCTPINNNKSSITDLVTGNAEYSF